MADGPETRSRAGIGLQGVRGRRHCHADRRAKEAAWSSTQGLHVIGGTCGRPCGHVTGGREEASQEAEGHVLNGLCRRSIYCDGVTNTTQRRMMPCCTVWRNVPTATETFTSTTHVSAG